MDQGGRGKYMWIIETEKYLYGPFKTSLSAEKWADKNLSLTKWVLRKLSTP